MYLWLRQGVEEQLQVLKAQGLVGDLQVKTDKTSGKKFVIIYTEVSDPTNEQLTEVLGELVERVTAKEWFVRGLRAEGVYHHGGATLVLKTELKPFSTFLPEVKQCASISGPSVEAVNTIYSLLRQGMLTPAENWEGDASVAPLPTAPAVPSGG